MHISGIADLPKIGKVHYSVHDRLDNGKPKFLYFDIRLLDSFVLEEDNQSWNGIFRIILDKDKGFYRGEASPYVTKSIYTYEHIPPPNKYKDLNQVFNLILEGWKNYVKRDNIYWRKFGKDFPKIFANQEMTLSEDEVKRFEIELNKMKMLFEN